MRDQAETASAMAFVCAMLLSTAAMATLGLATAYKILRWALR